MTSVLRKTPNIDDKRDVESFLLNLRNTLTLKKQLSWKTVNKEGSSLNDIEDKNTDMLPEGTANLYYTDERVDDRVSTLLKQGNAIILTYDDTNNTLTIAVTQAAASADAASSTVSVDSADADAVYSANEQDLVNELKADVNQLKTDLNAAITSLNDLKAKLRTANLLET